MPEFIAEHTPSGLDAFTSAYLECAEWLLDEEIDRAKVRGFTRAATRKAEKACATFQRDNAADLAAYEESTGRDMASAGHDFWLSRNGHGAGFWDRGKAECLDRLDEAAKAFGECDAYRGDTDGSGRFWLHLS